MSALARQQQALLDALMAWPPQGAIKNLANYAVDTRARGLKAYQSNAHALAQRALEGAYPVLARMLGDESFAALARAFWHAHPPQCGDVARWGQALAEFVDGDPQLTGEPFLGDVARCEWALHRAAFVADSVAEPATLSLLATEDPATVALELAAGTAVLQSVWPVVSLWQAHTGGEPSMAQAGRMVQERVGQDAVVWREGLRPRLRQALPDEIQLLLALERGDSVLAAVESAPMLDFAQWLPLAVSGGLVLRAHSLPTS